MNSYNTPLFFPSMQKWGLALGCGMLSCLTLPAESLLSGTEAFWGMAQGVADLMKREEDD